MLDATTKRRIDTCRDILVGKRSFFAGEYGWARLMAPNMGGFDVLAFYSEVIGRMNENPGIPPLFRDIFKNAYLPYRDPEMLRSFLKEIDGAQGGASEDRGERGVGAEWQTVRRTDGSNHRLSDGKT